MPEDTKADVLVLEEDKRNTPDFWRRWIKKARECEPANRHREAAAAAWREYEKEDDLSGSGGNILDGKRAIKPYPIYWSSCKTLEPAYYSRTPKVLSKRKGGIKDEIALTMSLLE